MHLAVMVGKFVTATRGSTEKCYLEASIALCCEWAGYLVLRDVLREFHNIVACTGRHV